jgi:glycosyltransferase involved in cell wall biosynthesis
VAPEEFQTDRPRDEIRGALDLRDDAFVVGLIQTWSHRKRQHVAIEAAALLAERLPSLRLLLAGGASRTQGDYEEEIRALISEKKLEDRVRMLPFTSEVAKLYQALDLHLQISGEEGFGRGIIEAGSAGIPSIGTKVGGIPEIIRDGKTGWLIPVDDPAALAEIIEKLYKDRETLKKAGAEAQKDASERFSIEVHARRVMNLYDEVIAARK